MIPYPVPPVVIDPPITAGGPGDIIGEPDLPVLPPDTDRTETVAGYEMTDVRAGELYKFTFVIGKYHQLVHRDVVGDVETWLDENAEGYKVERIYQYGDHVIAYLRVVDNPLPFLAVFGVVVVGFIASMVVLGLQVEKVERVIEKPAAAAIGVLAGIAAILIGINVLLD